MKKFFFILFLVPCLLFAQTDTTHLIKIHFLYGSKPLHKYKSTEAKFFGGLHGGHVSIEVDYIDYGFVPADDFHIFAHGKKLSSEFVRKETHGKPAYPIGTKLATIIIPVTEAQYIKINQIYSNYCSQTPYDYAFFGMRCANGVNDVLGQIGIIKHRNHFFNIVTTFYPKFLRKRMFKLAKKNHFEVIKQEGRTTRKWEKD